MTRGILFLGFPSREHNITGTPPKTKSFKEFETKRSLHTVHLAKVSTKSLSSPGTQITSKN